MLSRFGPWVSESSKISSSHPIRIRLHGSAGLTLIPSYVLVLRKVPSFSTIEKVRERFHAYPSMVKRSHMVTGTQRVFLSHAQKTNF